MVPLDMNDRLGTRARFLSVMLSSATLVFLAPSNLCAQAGTITGVIADSSGIPIAGAEVSIAGTGASVISAERGEFRISGLRTGTAMLRARRLGFRPDSLAVEVSDAATPTPVKLRLNGLAAQLAPVVVRTHKVEYKGRLAGYYERLDRRNSGYFITRKQIDDENPRTLAQLLQRAPGMSQFRGRRGLAGVRMRGRNCWPLVWLDGTQMPSGEVDLDGIPPSTLHGIELYLGSTTAPIKYTGSFDKSSCGTILLWSRGPDTDPITSKRGPAWSLEALIAATQVYTPDKVDVQASLSSLSSVNVEYPPALFAEHVGGHVTAEFVVDAQGNVEEETFGVVSSTDKLFTDAVRKAITSALYKPAIVAGKAVRQLVHQSFTFAPAGKGSTGPVAGPAR